MAHVPERIVLFGVESFFAPDVLETMRRLGIELAASVITGEPEWDMEGVNGVAPDALPADVRDVPCLVPWTTPGWRKQREQQARALGLELLPLLADPHAVTPSSMVVGPGSYLNAGVVLGAQVTFGASVFLNRGATVGHHARLDDYVSIGPGATLASSVRVGAGTFVGAGAAVIPGVTIGSNSVVGAGTPVHRDVPSNVVIAGNPFRIVKTDVPGHNGVGV